VGEEAKVSVIIPAFNSERWIKTCIDSVVNQSVKASEIIVIDDGSTDNAAGIVREYGEIVYLISQENKGVSAARNAGLAQATGNWIAFLDADDWWTPDKIEKTLNKISENLDIQLLSHDMYVADEFGGTVGMDTNEYSTNIYGADELLLANRVKTSSVMITSTLAKKVGSFREDLKRPAGCEDWDFWLRASEFTNFNHISEPLGYYRRLAQSAMRADGVHSSSNHLDDLLADMLTVIDDAALRHDALELVKRRAYASAYIDSSVRRLVAGDVAGARKDLAEVRTLRGWSWTMAILWIASFLPAQVRKLLLQLRRRHKARIAS